VLDDDHYFPKACVRRMVLPSDVIPLQYKYVICQSSKEKQPEFLNGIDKFSNWCELRPTSIRPLKLGWDKEGHEDARKTRHFVLKMGPPNGPRSKEAWSSSDSQAR
jgi:hypothetical protein